MGNLVLPKLEPPRNKVRIAKTSANWLIYGSVVLGASLLVQLYPIVPSSLFYSVSGGWVFYLATAIAASTGREVAYPSALVLAILTLFVSLPQPEHYSAAQAGPTPASITFVLGSILQVAVIISVVSYLFLKRKELQDRKLVEPR